MRLSGPIRAVIVLLLLGIVGVGAGLFGIRAGRHYEYNRQCCGMQRPRNMVVSVKESLGLLRFTSQIGQDRWVSEAVFPGVTNGYFVDVGSADGIFQSNTWALEQRGWSGVCIDPFPTNMETRTCKMFKDAVDSVGGRQVAFAAAGDLGGISSHLNTYKDVASQAKTVQLTTVTLKDILQRASAPSFIHFISLDIEGAELEALRGFPFDRYKIGALAIEHNCEEPKRSGIEALLKEHGYVRAWTWPQDDFYLPASR